MPLIASRAGGSASSFGGLGAKTGVAFLGPFGAFEPITAITVPSAGVSSITFNSIPSTYTHLQLRYITRNNRSGQSLDAINIRANGDTAANYANHRLQGDGTTASSSNGTSLGYSIFGQTNASTSTANVFTAGIMEILDYANTNKNKTFRTLNGFDANGSGYIGLYSGFWQSTVAINSLTLSSNDGSGMLEYSSFALYGIKGA
jgi:hypothetical protein